MISRRKIATVVPMFAGLGLLAACSSAGTTAAVPTLTQIQAYVNVLKTELPLFVQESISTGLVKTTDVSKVQLAVTDFVTLANQITSPSFDVSNVNATLVSLGSILTTVASFVPATAPYVGLIQLTIMLVSAFLAVQPVVVPPTPAPAQLATMHHDTLHFHKK